MNDERPIAISIMSSIVAVSVVAVSIVALILLRGWDRPRRRVVMSQQIRFAWATKPDQAEQLGAIELEPHCRTLVLALMARVLVAVVRVPRTGCSAMQEKVSDER